MEAKGIGDGNDSHQGFGYRLIPCLKPGIQAPSLSWEGRVRMAWGREVIQIQLAGQELPTVPAWHLLFIPQSIIVFFLKCKSDPVTCLLKALYWPQDKTPRLYQTGKVLSSFISLCSLPGLSFLSYLQVLQAPPTCVSFSHLLDHGPGQLFPTSLLLTLVSSTLVSA